MSRTTTNSCHLGLISSTDGSGNQTYYTGDGLGSTTDLTNSSATKTDGYTYDAFGTPTHASGSSTNPFQFTGQQTDAGSGLQYLRARYYDPSTGRFLGRDPAPTSLSNPAAGNPYAYVGGNPTSWIDPSGLWCPKDPTDCVPKPVRDWAVDRANDIAATATHVIQNRTNLLNYGVANEILGATISAFSSCDRQEKEGGIVIYENCTGGLAHLISTLNGGKAFTVGSFVFSPFPLNPELRSHELCHVRRYDNWGIVFLPAYFVVEPLPGTNPFESNADSCAHTHIYD